MKNLTAVIPTLNEEVDLPATLKSLSFAKEILVIDSGSTDKTLKIATDAGCRVIHHPFTSFANTRNFAQKHATYDWILSLEADVTITQSLRQEILSLPTTPSAYKICRLNHIWGKPIYHTDWDPRDDCHIRLYHRSLGRWSGSVHEQFTTPQPAKNLKHLIVHQNYRSVNEFIAKLNFYSEISSSSRHSKHIPFSFFRLIWETKYDFFKRYFYKLGFLDGYRGLFLSYLQGIYYLALNIKHKTS